MMLNKYIPEEKLLENCTKYLTYLHTLSCVFGLITCIFTAIVYSHWHSTLDTCTGTSDCGCIFYVTTTWNQISGGDIHVCYFVTYTHLSVFFASLCLAIYFCVQNDHEETRRKKMLARNRRSSLSIYQRSVPSENESDPSYTPLALSSGLACVLLFSTAYMATDGYFKTCKEYRKTAGKNLKATGNLASLLYERLSCATLLDIMDYTQPNSRNQEPRGGIIDTSFLLKGVVLCAWLHFFVWLILLFYNSLLAIKKSPTKNKVPIEKVRTETSI